LKTSLRAKRRLFSQIGLAMTDPIFKVLAGEHHILQKKKINAKTQGRKDFEKLNKIEVVFIQLSTVNKHLLKSVFCSLRLSDLASLR
jgi:hypothetical protein